MTKQSKKTAQASTEPKAEAKIEAKAAQVFPVPSAEVVISQDRTKLVPLPAMLYLEADPATVEKAKGHQIDPSRPEGYVAVMPDHERLETTGNPYPATGDDPSVVTADRWLPLVAVAHSVYAALKAKGEMGASELPEGVKDDITNKMAVRDALRDLALFGLARAYGIGRRKVYRIAD